jgi:hypothetical protein
MTRLVLGAVLTAALAFAGGGPAGAGGDEFNASKDSAQFGPAYFGFVRDTRGTPVPGAQIELRPKTGDPVVIKTNVLGLYRSHIRKDVNPDEVTVSCGKEGYKVDRVFRRTPHKSNAMFIETDCTLQKL